MEEMWTDGANVLELGSLLGLGVAQQRGCPNDALHHHHLHHEDLFVKSFEQTPDCKSMEGEHENLLLDLVSFPWIEPKLTVKRPSFPLRIGHEPRKSTHRPAIRRPT
ncbi:hypothetical protein ACFX2J_034194 [Malus domestica]